MQWTRNQRIDLTIKKNPSLNVKVPLMGIKNDFFVHKSNYLLIAVGTMHLFSLRLHLIFPLVFFLHCSSVVHLSMEKSRRKIDN